MKKGIYFNKENVQQAKANIKKFAWAQKQYDDLQREAEQLQKIPDTVIYDCIIHMKDETFAYGIAGCPHCRQPFPMNPEEQRGMFSPFHKWQKKRITCPTCQTTFPNASYDEDGQGLEINGKGYYLIGMWNFYYGSELLGGVRNHEGMVTKLTYLYMLTGDEWYARKALVILDAFSAIMPHTIGPRDFTPFGSDYLIGRVHLLTSIVHRIKVCLAYSYDWLYDIPMLTDISPALQRMGQHGTIQNNIEMMLNDYMLSEPGGPKYNLQDGHLTNLQNHEADGVRAMLAVGLVLDKTDYCKWGKQALEAYFFNTIGRDGVYYEGSFGYGLFTATVFLDMALLAMYASTELELKASHPFSNHRLFKFTIENPLRILCRGHIPSYGDWGRDTATSGQIDTNILIDVYRAALYFYQFSPDQNLQQSAKKYLADLYPHIKSKLGQKGIDLFFKHTPRSDDTSTLKLLAQSTFMGQSGLGIIRDQNDTTLLMRLGQNSTHAHDDVLGLNYYAKNKEISADIGYGIFATNGHFGWNSKAIAHNTVVVNEDEIVADKQLYKPFNGGEWTVIYENEVLKVMEGRAPELYQIDNYSRLVGIVPTAGELSYCIDFFNVKGSRIADYSFHAFHEQSDLHISNATKVPGHTPWTLAGLAEQDVYFNQKGKSFGERLTTGETFNKTILDEKSQGWIPDNNNGYGYIYQLQEYKTSDQVLNMNWTSEQGFRMYWSGMMGPKNRIFTGLGPSLEGETQHPYLIIRNTDRENCFASMFYTTHVENEQTFRMEQVRIDQQGVYALAVIHPNGITDYWVYAQTEGELTIPLKHGIWHVKGRVAMIRIDAQGSCLTSACIDARQMTYRETTLEGFQKKNMPVISVDISQQTIEIEGDLPKTNQRYLKVVSNNYPNGSLYPIETIHETGKLLKVQLTDSLILSKGIVVAYDDQYLTTSYPLPLGWDKGQTISSFTGKLINGAVGGKALIKNVIGLKKIQISLIKPFRKGENFSIIDIQKGDNIQWV